MEAVGGGENPPPADKGAAAMVYIFTFLGLNVHLVGDLSCDGHRAADDTVHLSMVKQVVNKNSYFENLRYENVRIKSCILLKSNKQYFPVCAQ